MRVRDAAAIVGILVLAWADPAKATVLGPDAFGYTATDEAPFSFTDISGTGTGVLRDGDDTYIPPVALGFVFDFYGTSYSAIAFSINGLMTFNSGTSDWQNIDLGAGPLPHQPMVAPLWDDWSTFGGGTVYYQTTGAPGSRQFIVQWNQVHSLVGGSPSPVTFQAILSEGSNQIRFNYLDVITGGLSNNGGYATVGIRDAGGQLNGEFLQWSHNQAVVGDSTSIVFTPTPVPEPTSLVLLGSGLLGVCVRGGRRVSDRHRRRCARASTGAAIAP